MCVPNMVLWQYILSWPVFLFVFFFCIQEFSSLFFSSLPFPYWNGCGKAVQLIRHIWHFFLLKGKPSCEAWAAWAAWAVQSSLTSSSRSSVLQLLKQLWVEGLRGGFELSPQHQGQGQARTVGKHSKHWRGKGYSTAFFCHRFVLPVHF